LISLLNASLRTAGYDHRCSDAQAGSHTYLIAQAKVQLSIVMSLWKDIMTDTVLVPAVLMQIHYRIGVIDKICAKVNTSQPQ
jgi:hypothetical protein